MSFTKKLTDTPEAAISSIANAAAPTSVTPPTTSVSTGSNMSTTSHSPAGAPKLEAFLGKNSKIVGKLSFTGAVELDGTVEGEIETTERLIIGDSANVNAKISGSEIIVKGTVSGDIVASKRLALHRTARIFGNVQCATISMEEGAIFEGQCTMPSAGNADLKLLPNRASAPEKAAVSIK
jgi:cytoskeletal protein CcmA (bactofilin family)